MNLREQLVEIISSNARWRDKGEYTLADAIIAALPGTVQPLVFWESDTGDFCCDSLIGRYQIQKGVGAWICMKAMGNKHRPAGDHTPTFHKSENEAKNAAQVHYAATIMHPFGLGS